MKVVRLLGGRKCQTQLLPGDKLATVGILVERIREFFDNVREDGATLQKFFSDSVIP